MPATLGRPRPSSTISAAAVLMGLGIAAPARAQYPVAPTPVINLGALTREPRFSGYISVRETYRSDTATFIINRARMAVQAAPAPFVGVRLQVDFAALGRTTGSSGDSIPAIQLTDAFVQLGLPDSTSRVERLLRPSLLIGQFRTPFGLEALTSFSSVITVNRALASDRLSTRRDRGIQLQVRFPRFVNAGIAAVDGEGSNRTSNPDGRQMAIGRIALLPIPALSISGKWAGQGSDHRWGYDARLVRGPLVLEGEFIRRKHPPDAATTTDVRGGYALAAYRVLPWLQPHAKWEQIHGEASRIATSFDTRATLTTVGVNFLAPQDRFRAQLDWIDRSEHPVARKGELVAQFQAIF